MAKIHNFSAGPSILPQEVFELASQAVLDLNGTGLSILEISHRSKDFIDIMDRATGLVKELLNVPDGYSVIFLQGGASLGFYATAINFMKQEGYGAYLDTGAWSAKAIKEANKLGRAEVVGSSKDENYSYVPKNYEIPASADYFHVTSNNTIFGTQLHDFPSSPVPMIADMSSDIFSRKLNISDFAMIYAGAQKNMGPAGTTLYIVKDELLHQTGRDLPSMLDLQLHASKDSMFNTPPVFAVFTVMLTLEWLKSNGGLDWIQERNNTKAAALYNEIDNNPLFKGTARVEDRSKMNVTFVLEDEANKERFDTLWNEAGISGIKGHRSVGGYRASIYNAMPPESVDHLIGVMQQLNA